MCDIDHFKHVDDTFIGSLGVTALVEAEAVGTLLKRVDDALHLAKKNGLNRVEVVGAEDQ